MERGELDRQIAELNARCAKLSAEDQERVLEGWAEVLTLCELPREPGEAVSLVVTLHRDSEVTHLSG